MKGFWWIPTEPERLRIITGLLHLTPAARGFVAFWVKGSIITVARQQEYTPEYLSWAAARELVDGPAVIERKPPLKTLRPSTLRTKTGTL